MYNSQPAPIIRLLASETSDRELLIKRLQFEGWRVRAYAYEAAMYAQESWERPGCLILEIDSFDAPLAMLDRLREADIVIPVVVVSDADSIELAVESMKRGAKDFLRKAAGLEALVEVVARLIVREKEDLHLMVFAQALATLSARERQVIELSVLGKSHDQVAELLGIAVKTAQLHRYNAYCKLGSHNITEISRHLMLIERLPKNGT